MYLHRNMHLLNTSVVNATVWTRKHTNTNHSAAIIIASCLKRAFA
jgi:hypothetical protein